MVRWMRAHLDLHFLAQLGVEVGSGSSSSSSCGWITSARASATRCCCPPDSCAGSARPMSASAPAPAPRATRCVRVGARPAAHLQRRRRCFPPPSCAGTARSSGTRCPGRARGGVSARSRPSSRIGPRVGLDEAGDHLQGGGLAAAGRTEQRDELAARDSRAKPSTASARRTPCQRSEDQVTSATALSAVAAVRVSARPRASSGCSTRCGWVDRVPIDWSVWPLGP